MNNKLELTIILPCLNEAKTLPTCINEAKNFLTNYHVNGKILIANNNSTDNSKKIALNMGADCVDIQKIGYGSAIINSLKEVTSTYCVIADSDASYNLKELMPFLEKLRSGYDLVIGNRFLGNIEKNSMP
ncbi:MAG: glycosyltransferase family 2 protein [Coriobacteriia bacterium]|nr:glycosyltransferase family 2 protein [Coriobacteriia bacterium]